jgi:hypothetical protein
MGNKAAVAGQRVRHDVRLALLLERPVAHVKFAHIFDGVEDGRARLARGKAKLAPAFSPSKYQKYLA